MEVTIANAQPNQAASLSGALCDETEVELVARWDELVPGAPLCCCDSSYAFGRSADNRGIRKDIEEGMRQENAELTHASLIGCAS